MLPLCFAECGISAHWSSSIAENGQDSASRETTGGVNGERKKLRAHSRAADALKPATLTTTAPTTNDWANALSPWIEKVMSHSTSQKRDAELCFLRQG